MKELVGLIAGLLFGAGMAVSGMTDPERVLGFLDITGEWEPNLAFVMGAAVLIAAPAFWYARKGGKTFTDHAPIVLPRRSPITLPLIAGAAVFGLGWGLSGLCPGPVLVVASGGSLGALAFVAAMALGMLLSSRLFGSAARG